MDEPTSPPKHTPADASANSLGSAATNSDTATNACHGWARLPNELKLEIIEYRLLISDTITSMMHPTLLRCELLPLLLTSKEMCTLATETYYGLNNFRLDPYIYDDKHMTFMQFRWRFRYPKPGVGAFIKRLEVHIDIKDSPCTKSGFENWALLLHPRQPMVVPDRVEGPLVFMYPADTEYVETGMEYKYAHWQAAFPNLDILKIVLVLKGYFFHWRRPDGDFDGMEIKLQPKQVEIVVESDRCGEYGKNNEGGAVCRYRCAEKIGKAVKSMITLRGGTTGVEKAKAERVKEMETVMDVMREEQVKRSIIEAQKNLATWIAANSSSHNTTEGW